MSVRVIGEPGCTAQGDFDKMKRLVEIAADCGADAIKPQWVSSADKMITQRTKRLTKPEADAFREKYRTCYGWLAFPVTFHGELSRYARSLGLRYVVTVFLREDVGVVAGYADCLKVSSFEASDAGLVNEALETGKQVFVSTGMLSAEDALALDTRATLMQCTTAYPAPLESMHLKALGGRIIGLSDHSRSLATGAAAVALGAEVIETHFRAHDCDPTNPDFAVAFNPDEYAAYIANVRDVEKMLGFSVKAVQGAESWALPYRVTS